MLKKPNYTLLIIIILLTISSQVLAAGFDEEIREIVLKNETPFIDDTMSFITYLGDGAVDYVIASALPDEEAKLDAQKAILVSGVSTFVLKSIIGQKRPPGPIEYKHFTLDSNYHAMPSGHTATAFALATSIATHYPEYKRLSYTMATLVGISRLYEDRHWASDVVAGAVVGYYSAKFVEYKW